MENKKYILAFGDSLTKGYYLNGYKYHPYSIKLNQLLKENNFNYEAIPSGINGETTDKMIDRIEYLLADNSKIKFNIVIIYAGANDMHFRSAVEIAKNIISIHKLVIESGLKSILVTLPENEVDDIYKWYGEKRVEINEILKKEIKNLPNILLCDLDQELKYSKMKKDEKKLIWDDNIHYTPEGYNLLGNIIFKSLNNFL